MITVISMCMIVHPAISEIEKMGGNNECNGRYQQPGFVVNKKLPDHQENKTGKEKGKWQQTMMMLFVAMIKRITANT